MPSRLPAKSSPGATPRALTALVAGTLTLGLEIVVGRLLAPYFGSSLHQWAALIGVVLLAYAAGYWLHEAIARGGLALPLAAGGVWALALPLWLDRALAAILGLPLAAASVLGAALAAGVPSLLWATVLPELQRRAGPGRESARVLAWSAAGNLLGAWGVAFVAVPGLGTRVSLAGIGLAALALGGAWARETLAGRARALLGLLLVAGAAAAVTGPAGRTDAEHAPWLVADPYGPSRERTLVTHRDSPYQSVSIWDERDPDGETRRLLALNGSLQFRWSRSEPLTRGARYAYYNYATAAALWPAAAPARSALILGLGGGLVPWQLRRHRPEIAITAYELDPVVAEEAARTLPLAEAGEVDVRVGDARQLLRADGARYDLVLLDTFLHSYVPFHLTTREFFELARARLAPGGVLVANFHTVFATSGLLTKLEATMADVFPSVAAFDLPAGTTLIVAAAEPEPLVERLRAAARAAEADPRLAPLAALTADAAARLRSVAAPEAALLLTDDRNDTEQRLYETRQHIFVSRAF